MNILALEASNNCALVAAKVETQSEVVAALRLDEPRALARELAICVSRLMETAGWNWQNLDALAVGLGPGSWTSLRIALSTWKTLSLARRIPLVGVPTFDAVAYAASKQIAQNVSTHTESTQQFLLAVTSRCRPGEIYSKIFLCSQSIEPLTTEETTSPAQLAQRLAQLCEARSLPLFVSADDGGALAAELQNIGMNWQNITVEMEDVVLAIAQIGAENLKSESPSPMELLPLYVAASSAERVAAERRAAAERQNATPQNA